MSLILSQFNDTLMEHFHLQEESSLDCLSIYRCYLPQQLRSIPFHQPTLLMVASGQKKVQINTANLTVDKGDLLVVPADTTVWVEQYGRAKAEPYLGLAFRFDFEALKHFRQIYGASLDQWDITNQWKGKVTDQILTLLSQWVIWGSQYPADPQLSLHRQVELLLLLAKEGLIGNILVGEHPSWKYRVSQLLSIDPSHAWLIVDVCSRLGVSESSLRRKLQDEKCTFRELLEEVRLTSSLSMILETTRSIGQIADAVGYQSQSRYGERFKKRFGMTPTELRQSTIEI